LVIQSFLHLWEEKVTREREGAETSIRKRDWGIFDRSSKASNKFVILSAPVKEAKRETTGETEIKSFESGRRDR
jgi:hypothetical protein